VNERQPVLDNAKFWAVTLVVVGHLLEPLRVSSHSAWTTYLWIYSFHIPALVFVAGVTSRTRPLREVAESLLVPYVVFTLIYWVAMALAPRLRFATLGVNVNPLRPYWLLWFLVSLFCWRALLSVVSRVPRAWLWAVGVALVAGAASWVGHLFSLSRTLFFFPFFLLGHQHGRTVLAWLQRPWVSALGVAVLVAGWAVFWKPLETMDCRWLYGSAGYSELGVSVLPGMMRRLGVLAMSVVMGAAFLSVMPLGQTIITQWGARSLQPFLWHGLIVKALAHWVPESLRASPWAFPVAVIIGVALTCGLSTTRVERMTELLFPFRRRRQLTSASS
jgi:fucose 4-O-acetylase-like acetyltransferase